MWDAIPEDARRDIGELCTEYGARLIDYNRTELAEPDAALATCGALLSAHVHAERPAESVHLRAWLYALARAHRSALAGPTSTGSWRRPGPVPELLPEALATLETPHREVLDLVHRHALTDDEIALIFGVGAAQVASVHAEAGAALEIWFAAVTTAQEDGGCAVLGGLVSEWTAAPTRRTRTQISRHIGGCGECRRTPITVTAAELMRQLTPLPAPEDLADGLATARPLPDDAGQWRLDGFPVQVSDLGDQDSVEFRAWDKRAELGERFFSEKPPPVPDPEFYAPRADEADPESRFTLKSVARILVVTVAGAGLCLVLVRGLFTPAGGPPVVTAAPRNDVLAVAPTPTPDILIELPPDDTSTAPVVVNTTGVPPQTVVVPVAKPTTKPTASTKPTVRAATQTEKPKPQPKSSGPAEPPPQGTKPTSKPDPTKAADKTQPPPKPALPKPPPPTASVSGGGSLGTGRSGSFSLSVSPGSGNITGASASSGISVSGSSFTITDPTDRPGCTDAEKSGTITVSWSGSNSGDGTSTEGTTSGSGTLTVSVAWVVKADKGYQVQGPNGTSYWSNCH